MKRIGSLIIAAALALSNARFALADDVDYEADITYAPEVTETNEVEAARVELLAAVDGITFEYDYSASTDLVRVVKVKYDKSYFTTGINSFKAEINIPSQNVADVSHTTKLTGFDITDGYSGNVYTCTGTSGTDKIPVDGCLFTMRITLKNNILTPLTIALTGDSSLGDSSGITQYLSNGGMNAASLEIPANINDVGDSGVDGAVSWEYANEVLKLHGNGTMKDYEQGSAPWYQYADKIKSIEFTEDNLQNIGRYAFYGLKNAENVILSADISAINNSAFEGCSSLRNIDIPANSGVGIGDYAFKDCSELTSLYIPSGVRTIGRGAFEGCSKLASVTLPFIGSQKGDSNSKNTFSYIFNDKVPVLLRVVSITNETVVPESAFESCALIENIYINDEVSKIGEKAFKGCTRLTSFRIPSRVTEINDYTFQNCSNITTIDIHSGISAIGEGAFDGCQKLASIYIPSAVNVINSYTFRNCASLTKIEIPVTVTGIGESVLAGCTKLVDIKVPFVGANANPGSTAVTNEGIFGYFFGVTDNNLVPAAVTTVEITSTDRSGYIPKEAFRNCGNIEDIIIDGGRNVLDNAFKNCKNLRNLYIPKSISNIGTTILADCTRLETITVPFIGTDRNDKNTENSVLGGFFGYNDADITGTLQYYNENGGKHYYKVPRTLKNVSVLNQTTIPTGAFSECDFIENVSVVTGATMNEKAFYHCASLKEVVLPNDLQTIGAEAFAECESLETINIPTKVRTIGEQVFYNARALRNVTMPDSVTTIADDVFNGTGLFGVGDEVQLMDVGTITCSSGSAAEAYANEHNIATNIVPSSELEIKSVGANMSVLATGDYLIDVTDTNNLSGTVYAGIYDSNGILLAVRSVKTSSDEVEYRLTFSAEESQGVAKAKVFVWGGANGVTSQTTSACDVAVPSAS